jgi:D-inositol-3-phosphate glycosyltransferase
MLEKLQRGLERRILPTLKKNIRGIKVAADSVVEALVKHGNVGRYEFFIAPSLLEKARNTLQSYQPVGHRPGARNITSVTEILGGVDKYRLNAWFDPSGAGGPVLEARRRFQRRLCPVTILSHGFSIHSMLYNWFLRTLLCDLQRCDSIICTSRASREAMLKIMNHVSEEFNREWNTHLEFCGRVDLIPLCVDTEKLMPRDKLKARKRLGLPQKALIILYLGYVSPSKADLLPLFRVLSTISKTNSGHNLLLIIAGSCEPGYEKLINSYIGSLRLQKSVRIITELPDDSKSDLLPAADIFVAPTDSPQESFGLTPVEAMACGVPQVVADWDGYRDTVINGDTGFLVPTYWSKCDSELSVTGDLTGWEMDHLAIGASVAIDIDALTQSLQILISNQSLREQMSRNSRLRATTLYGYGQVAFQYEALWDELSKCADNLPPGLKQGNFLRPSYFSFFSGHASTLLNDDAIVTLTSIGLTALKGMDPWALHRDTLKLRFLDRGILTEMLEVVARSSGSVLSAEVNATRGITIGSIVVSLSSADELQDERVRRHLMWLLKQGLVRIVVV